MDEKLVQALLQTEDIDAFFACHTQHTGRDTGIMGEFAKDEQVWKHLQKLLREHKDSNICIMPEGWEVYIPNDPKEMLRLKMDKK